MRNMRFNVAAFISAYSRAAAEQRDVASLAEELGLKCNAIFWRKHALKKRGITLPALPHRTIKGKRRAAKPAVQVSVRPAPEPVAPRLGFQFDVSNMEVNHGIA